VDIKEFLTMKFYSVFAVSLIFTCSLCTSKPVAQSVNPCVALELPLCRIKSDFANKHGIKNDLPIKASRPKLNSALLRPKPAAATENQHSVKADDGTSLLSILRPKSAQPNRVSTEKEDNRDANNSCKGLRFCVLKKDVSEEKRRPDSGSTFVPTVRTPQETDKQFDTFFQEEFSEIKTFPSLLFLIRDGKLEEAKQYIEEGADVNEEDTHGNSLLLIAAQNGRDGVVRDLLLGGADVNKGNSHRNGAIHLAAQNGWPLVMETLLMAKKIKVNFKDLHANTALHLAAQNGQIEVVRMLLDRKDIQLNPKNTHKLVPLHLAAQNGFLELARLLATKEGTNLNSKDLQGNTPLHTAYHTTHPKIANMLIGLGANPNARNLVGLTPQDLGKR